MSDKIKSNNERIEILTNKTIRDKLLTYFRMNTNGGNNRILYLPFTLTDLADYLAVDRSAMSNELCKMRDEGLIVFEKNQSSISFKWFLLTTLTMLCGGLTAVTQKIHQLSEYSYELNLLLI